MQTWLVNGRTHRGDDEAQREQGTGPPSMDCGRVKQRLADAVVAKPDFPADFEGSASTSTPVGEHIASISGHLGMEKALEALPVVAGSCRRLGPSRVMATPTGPSPTSTVATTVLVAVSITETSSDQRKFMTRLRALSMPRELDARRSAIPTVSNLDDPSESWRSVEAVASLDFGLTALRTATVSPSGRLAAPTAPRRGAWKHHRERPASAPPIAEASCPMEPLSPRPPGTAP
jgi:hypothetical protein